MKSRTLYWIKPKKFIPQSFTPIFISFRSFRKKWKRRRSSHRAKSPLQINPSNAFQKRGKGKRRNARSWLPWAAARRRMLLFAPETRALWDLVAGLRLLVGVLPSGVPLPLSFSLSTLSLSLAPEGGIASNICSMLENPGAQIEADLVFRRRELSDILRAIPSTISSPKTFPTNSLVKIFLSLFLFLYYYLRCTVSIF